MIILIYPIAGRFRSGITMKKGVTTDSLLKMPMGMEISVCNTHMTVSINAPTFKEPEIGFS